MRCSIYAFCVLLASMTGLLSAGPIVISGYNIDDAVMSGHGNWAHTYNGTITPTQNGSFTNNGFIGLVANYSGFGSGTLNDGVIGGSTLLNTQLFVSPSASSGLPVSPVITLQLGGGAHTLNTLEIYGGNSSANPIPGSITSVTVGILGLDLVYQELSFATVAFGMANGDGSPVNDRISFAGTAFAGVPVLAVTLRSFQGTVSNWFSISEIVVDGDQYGDIGQVPEPTTLSLMGISLLWIARGRRRQLLR